VDAVEKTIDKKYLAGVKIKAGMEDTCF